jgi:hypothetical protein
MPQIFLKNNKIKVIQYGVTTPQEFSFRSVANDIFCAFRKFIRR